MSRDELVHAYVEGSVSRRTFVRRLVATGVSLGAAISYAHLLSPDRSEAAQAKSAADFYTPAGISVEILSGDLDKVVDKRRIRVRVTTDEAATIQLIAEILEDGEPLAIASTVLSFGAPGTQVVKLRITKAGVNALEGREKATVTIKTTAQDQQNSFSANLVSKKLK